MVRRSIQGSASAECVHSIYGVPDGLSSGTPRIRLLILFNFQDGGSSTCHDFKFSVGSQAAVCCSSATPANAQHNHRGHNDVVHHGNHHDVVHHHGSHFGNSNWNYVVPAHHGVHQHSGSFYVQGDAHYYTPTPIVRVTSCIVSVSAVASDVQVTQPVQLQFGGFARCEDLAGQAGNRSQSTLPGYVLQLPAQPRFRRRPTKKPIRCSNRQNTCMPNSTRVIVMRSDTMSLKWMDCCIMCRENCDSGPAITHVRSDPAESSKNQVRLKRSCITSAIDVGIEPHGDDEPAPAPGVGEEQAPAPGGVINSPPPLGF